MHIYKIKEVINLKVVHSKKNNNKSIIIKNDVRFYG
jgi:hypothetical protein